METESITIFQMILLFVFGGGFITLGSLLWRYSKRDSLIDTIFGIVKKQAEQLEKLENNVKNEDEELEATLKNSETRIIDIEKDLIEIKSNQKNLMHSIDSQNFQILNLIERLEKNHEGFIASQSKINDKLEAAINAIKDSLINLTK